MPYVFPKQKGENILAKQIRKEQTATFSFGIADATNDIDAMVALEAYLGTGSTRTVRGTSLVFDAIKLKHVECDLYEADVDYVHPDKQADEEDQNNDSPQLSFDNSGTTQQITHSFETLRAYGADPNKHSQAIGVEKTTKGQLKIKGTTVVIPSCKLSVSAKINKPTDPFEFGRNMARQVGKCNRSPWNGFQKWEMRFDGGKLTGKRREKWTLDYQFDCDEEITAAANFKIGELGPIVKEGHAHLWVEWKQVVKAATSEGDVMGTEPAAVFIERVCRDFELSVLGL